MKKILVAGWLLFISCAIAGIFWHIEWVYSLPTPVPVAYKAIHPGQYINTGAVSTSFHNIDTRPVFLHFFNPDCPCSRFNISYFKALVKEYGREVNFIIVPMTNKNYTAKDIQQKFDLDIPIVFDTALAVSCGVYSTPQAVIIGADHRLYYRGNYNRSRYCTDKKTNYAQMALDSLLEHRQNPAFNQYALRAYGCQLPNCIR